jgi:two-component system nitrogen regulation response regulator GlnG
MPGISGLEVLSRMQEEHPRVPVILMTAFASPRVCEQALQSGAVAVLAKPFSIVAFDKLVAQHVIKG